MKKINKSIDKERLFLRSSSNTIPSRHTLLKHIKEIDLWVKKFIKILVSQSMTQKYKSANKEAQT